MSLMPTRKRPDPDTDPGRKNGPKRTGVPLHIYIPPELRQAIDDCADANRRKLTQEVVIALEEHLKRQGLWPPKDA